VSAAASDRSLRAAWARARRLAAETPDSRNRYVDFLRAASIVVVVIGHWLMAAPSVERGEFTLSDMLQIAPWTRWLTWIFQVMPLFFIVGGYANAASWEGARAAGRGYDWWLSRRLRRLVRPVVPVLLAWCAIAFVAPRMGLSARSIEIGSQTAFVPTWFLSVYVMVVVAAPAMYALWRRLGMAPF
jgi:fucose 4-O-acetylase-like acetyltransferase